METSVGETATTNEREGDVKLEGSTWTYTDPETGLSYWYDLATEKWVESSERPPQPAASDGSVQCVDDTWIHRDPESGVVSVWDPTENAWMEDKEEEISSSSENDETVSEEDELNFQLKQERREKRRLAKERKAAKEQGKSVFVSKKDGTVYEWDGRAWTPQINDEFIARYQANYGVASSTAETPEPAPGTPEEPLTKQQRLEQMKQKKKEQRKLAAEKQKQDPKWFEMEESDNRNVYVTGLPSDVKLEEFQELMSKYGVIDMDPRNRKFKLKLYSDEEGGMKGDGLCCYVKKESVDLALNILDGYQLRGRELKVERAHFQQKGDYDPSKKKRKLNAKQIKKFKESQQKLFDWRPEKMKGERPKSDCTVVLKNLFAVEEFKEDAALLIDLKEQVKQECSKYGEVKKLTIFDNNPEGVSMVSFGTPEMAEDCVTMMEWRMFRGRQLRAQLWDGQTRYKVREEDADKAARIDHWQKFLQQQ